MAKKVKSINILFTCVGRRVSLLNSFRKAAKQLKLKAKFIGTDKIGLSPALALCDKQFITKPVASTGYVRDILKIVKDNKVDLIVPTIDTELKKLAANKDKFEKLGCRVLISSENVVDICQDKRKTFKFLKKNGFDTPETMSLAKALKAKRLRYPLFLKPWDGSASKGNRKANNKKELEFYGKRIKNCIVQEFIDGQEYTCDVYVDNDMKVRCVVPRKRIEVRGGEVSKGQVAKDPVIMNAAKQVVEALGAGAGVITIQLIKNKRTITVIEFNARIGGGAPLGIKAGADYPKWILQELTSKKTRIKFDDFKDKLIMLRYDSEVFLLDQETC